LAFACGLLGTPLLALLLARGLARWERDSASDPRRAVALATTACLTEALDGFFARHHRAPSHREGLAALVPDWIERLPLDPWGRPYVYALSSGIGHGADVLSYGADGLAGGAGAAADVSGRYGVLRRQQSWVPELAGKVACLAFLVGSAAAARRSAWAAGGLAGCGGLAALLLLTLLDPTPRMALPALLISAIALACLTGSVALARGAAGAPLLTVVAVLSAYVVLENLIVL
jgi:general secretion pathway protein G